jgi:hypothetical protein
MTTTTDHYAGPVALLVLPGTRGAEPGITVRDIYGHRTPIPADLAQLDGAGKHGWPLASAAAILLSNGWSLAGPWRCQGGYWTARVARRPYWREP